MSVRIAKEAVMISKQPVPGCKISVDPSNNRLFYIIINGPPDTPYEGGHFDVQLFLPESYPLSPPKIQFMTKIYHPNIDLHGRVCLNILKDDWSAVMNVRTVAISIMALLSSPNPDDGLDPSIASHFRNDPEGARAKARDWVKQYAMD